MTNLVVDGKLKQLITTTLSDLGIADKQESILEGFAEIVKDLEPKNRALLNKRADLQRQIDVYLKENSRHFNAGSYEALLKRIGYIVEEKVNFAVETKNVDVELSTPGPQLVCPVFIGEDPKENARYHLNAVNARWM